MSPAEFLSTPVSTNERHLWLLLAWGLQSMWVCLSSVKWPSVSISSSFSPRTAQKEYHYCFVLLAETLTQLSVTNWLKVQPREEKRDVSLGLLGVVVLQAPGLPGWSWKLWTTAPGTSPRPYRTGIEPPAGRRWLHYLLYPWVSVFVYFSRTWSWEWKAWQMSRKSCANWKALKRSE